MAERKTYPADLKAIETEYGFQLVAEVRTSKGQIVERRLVRSDPEAAVEEFAALEEEPAPGEEGTASPPPLQKRRKKPKQ